MLQHLHLGAQHLAPGKQSFANELILMNADLENDASLKGVLDNYWESFVHLISVEKNQVCWNEGRRMYYFGDYDRSTFG